MSVVDEFYINIFKRIRTLEKSLGLPHGFATSLREDEDWSFVLKLNALFEAALTELICAHLGNDELREPISHLDIGDTRKGKVIFARKLGLLDENQNRFIQWLYELRNHLAHDIKTTVGFNLKTYVDSLGLTDQKRYAKALKGVNPPDSVFSDPKGAVFVMAMIHLALVEMQKELSRIDTAEKETLTSAMKLLIEKMEVAEKP